MLAANRADHGPKHAPGVILGEGSSNSRTAQKETVIKSAIKRSDVYVKNSLTETSPLPKSGAFCIFGVLT